MTGCKLTIVFDGYLSHLTAIYIRFTILNIQTPHPQLLLGGNLFPRRRPRPFFFCLIRLRRRVSSLPCQRLITASYKNRRCLSRKITLPPVKVPPLAQE